MIEAMAWMNMILAFVASLVNLLYFVRRTGYERWIRLAYAVDMLVIFVIYIFVNLGGGVTPETIRMAIFLMLVTILTSSILAYFDCDDVLRRVLVDINRILWPKKKEKP